MHRLIVLIGTLLGAACAPLPVSPVPEPAAPHSHAVVFDIDGTLTPDVLAVFEVRPDAATVVSAYSDKGYEIIYLSTRTAWLSAGLPSWLRRHGFPQGSVHVAQTSGDRRRPDAYKSTVLRAYQARGWAIDYAFGDSSTDMAAYASVGIPKEHVFALLRRGQAACQPGAAAACLAGWSEHLGFVEASVPGFRGP